MFILVKLRQRCWHLANKCFVQIGRQWCWVFAKEW